MTPGFAPGEQKLNSGSGFALTVRILPPMISRRTWFFAIAAFLVATIAAAQEPMPAQVHFPNVARSEQPVGLTHAWRFHPGDDPRWSAPTFDDRGWAAVDPRLPFDGRPREGWTGVGWFRRHVVVTDDVPSRRVVLAIEAPGQVSVYLDGALVVDHRGPASGTWTRVDLSPGRHVLAVRYTCDCASDPGSIGFTLTLDLPESEATRIATASREALTLGAFVSIPAILGVLHLALFFFYPKARENLFCALCILSLTLIIGASAAKDLDSDRLPRAVLTALQFAGIAGATFFGLMTYAVLRIERIPRTWIGFAIGGALLPLASPFVGGTVGNVLWTLYFIASVAEIVRIERMERTVHRENASPLLIGMLLLDTAIVLQILIEFGVIPAPFNFGSIYLAGALAFCLSTSLFVARSFARTSLHLERRMVEIEAARILQRSILPLTIPQLPHLEVAAQVTTASEVGGDYYDFRVDDEQSLTVAIGDAAGHGVAAGAMVTATKALFSSMAGEASLPVILAKCDRVLRGMNVRPLHMCLLLARVTPHSISVSSAAMPRPLLFRAASGKVEELVVGGLPLAAAFTEIWTEKTETLAMGDVVLFASDGLAEGLSPAGDPLGYEGVAAMLAAAAPGASSAQIVETLMRQAESWRGTRPQNDDIAMVALRVTATGS